MGQKKALASHSNTSATLPRVSDCLSLPEDIRDILSTFDASIRGKLIRSTLDGPMDSTGRQITDKVRLTILLTVLADFAIDTAIEAHRDTVLEELQEALRDSFSWAHKKREAGQIPPRFQERIENSLHLQPTGTIELVANYTAWFADQIAVTANITREPGLHIGATVFNAPLLH
jgi:hypothetical protein